MTDRTRDIVALSDLSSEMAFDITLSADDRAELAGILGFESVKKARLSGVLRPEGPRDWVLEADLGATIVQECVVTLAPVSTRIDTKVTRHYVADFEMPDEASEIEMPDDETKEPLPRVVNLVDVLAEALSIAAPDFPRAPDAELGEAIYTAPGEAPMTDEDTKPFAGLRALRDGMEKDNEK